MKKFGFFLLLASVVACDPYGFGYKKNPAFVLDEAFKAISNLDVETFVEMTGKEALCVYGNEAGMQFLKENLQINPENLKITPKVLETHHLKTPVFTEYWSYYQERYEIEIRDKITNKEIAGVIVDCDFGTNGEKDPKQINKAPHSYKKKECHAVKIIPRNFQALPVPQKCGPLRIEL